MKYELVGFNTDSRFQSDVRWRQYTTSKKRAEEFEHIRKIQFSDSGHGIVFDAREVPAGELRKPDVGILREYVRDELRRIKRELKLPIEVRTLIERSRRLIAYGGEPSDDVLENQPHTVPGDVYDRFHAAVKELG